MYLKENKIILISDFWSNDFNGEVNIKCVIREDASTGMIRRWFFLVFLFLAIDHVIDCPHCCHGILSFHGMLIKIL